jgi:hypothetical protein
VTEEAEAGSAGVQPVEEYPVEDSSKRTELNCKSQPVGGTATLSDLLQVRFCQCEVLAESIVVDLIGQTLWLFHPVTRTGIFNGSRCRIQDFPPTMARK